MEISGDNINYSGKGGTGKTTVAANLTFTAWAQQAQIRLSIKKQRHRNARLIAATREKTPYSHTWNQVPASRYDVEEPNCHIFLHPEFFNIKHLLPYRSPINETLCTLCSECGKICAFRGIMAGKKKSHCLARIIVMAARNVLQTLPGETAIKEIPREVGSLPENPF